MRRASKEKEQSSQQKDLESVIDTGSRLPLQAGVAGL
jgi:hypothetical protein